MLKLIVGLGNPGPQYEGTRHNAGFWWVDNIAQRYQITLNTQSGFFAELGKGHVEDQVIWLLKPSTFMNHSGQSVAAFAKFYKIQLSEILVVHDELDLLPGQVKIKQGGSHAGHNGLKDIQARLGSADFWRLRIGVGHPGIRSEVINWVLRKPALDDKLAIDQALDRAMAVLKNLVAEQMQLAMRELHGST